jgi:hypothetical protein
MASKTNDIIWNESKLAIVASISACVHDISSVGGVSREMKTTTVPSPRERGASGHLQTLQQRSGSAGANARNSEAICPGIRCSGIRCSGKRRLKRGPGS